jgi:hypothetical protein
MATDREIAFLVQALHHLMSASTYQFQTEKFLRAFIQKDSTYVDKVLSKLGYGKPDEEKRKEVTRICNKMKRQWKDSRTTVTHKPNDDTCECQLCLIDKLKEFVDNSCEVRKDESNGGK